MMTVRRESKLSETAVDGLLAGIGAGIGMAAYLIAVGWFAGNPPSDILTMFSASGSGSPGLGTVSHLAVSAIYGAVFGVLVQVAGEKIPRWATGLGYGVLLYLLAQFVLIPGTGSSLALLSTANLVIAHLVYGLLAGVLFRDQK